MTLKDELEKVFHRAKDRGIREGVRCLRGRIYSTSSYSVFRHSLETIPDVKLAESNIKLREVTSLNDPCLHELHRVYPPEFGPRDPNYVSRVLKERSRNGVWCFAACDQDQLVGAFWLSPPNHWYANLDLPYLPGEYVVQNLFVVSNYRGLGVSKLLLNYGLQVAGRRAVSSVLSLIPADRTASLRAHLSLGFQIIGSFRRDRRWFKHRQSFVAAENKE
ncbi:MAG: GNAT family N-acetyltransferase [Planctomycetota bacterium]|nr:GNAT family N-acetyltransferase [Planctomycetota bacterium]